MSNFAATVDVRIYEPKDKRTTILKTFENINIGETMELVNDHDPRPLYDHFNVMFPNKFEWNYLEQGPELWRIGITKK
ncbi:MULTISPECIES: DUF2249 domain-containing protein [Clostridium]|jgi:uncharacterized protein (DUF2249 family)|uniref:DUF2249 domain-containing protein n=1 Tax=Clostridium TaxID=1485 RepID=UPI000983ADAE|nr:MULTISPECIES: DUF2249 domain-containing protein [Clostridium]AQR93710.1 hypothetical protein CLSAP_10170 [Clostridium saccharoperbutylacetonicum]NSB29409.1 uncharacterized protein (DUF2249 family) [Clostridium saccharoperbutylacetonicum]